LAAVAGWQAEFLRKLGVRFVYPTDEWFVSAGKRVPPKKYYDGLELEENGLGLVRSFLDEWQRVKKDLAGSARHSRLKRPATIVTGRLFEATLCQAANEFNALTGARLRVRGVDNDRFGHSVTVAGLLTGRDIIAQLRGEDLGRLVVLPRIMFDHPCGLSLDGLTPLDVARGLGRPVFLAETMRDVLEALTGHNRLQFDPAGEAGVPEVRQAGAERLVESPG
jgi:NifB/MoaA-like Fe-S oxidoreductase